MGSLSIDDVSQTINAIYEEIVHWRKNLFVLPSGAAGKSFVREMTHMIELWKNDTALKNISLKALMILPSLMLQKTRYPSKSKSTTNISATPSTSVAMFVALHPASGVPSLVYNLILSAKYPAHSTSISPS